MKLFAIIGLVYALNVYGCGEHNKLHIGRLDKHFTLLNQFNKKNKKAYLINWGIQTTVPFFYDLDLDCVSYTHPLIVLCLKKMKNTRTIDPLFETWSLFLRGYKDVDCELFLQEISRMLFCLYKNIFQTFEVQSLPRVSVVEIVVLYNKINTLPIDEVLVALEHCYVRLVFVLKEYEFFSQMSWHEWLTKYWWVPPVIVLGVAWKILLYKTVTHFVAPSLADKEPDLDFAMSLLG